MRRSAMTLVGLALLAAAPGAAGAATLTLDHGCYLAKQPRLPSGQTIVVRAEGFAPDAPVTFRLGATPVLTVNADAAGAATGQFAAPSLGSPSVFRATRTLTASDGAVQASTALELRQLAADFLPSRGNPRTLRVRFYVYGFGPLLTALGRRTSQRVYEHVFDPRGRRRVTTLVGRTSGPCGDLRTTRRRILPFRRVRDGRWRFVFTTSPRYSRNSAPLASIGFIVTTVFRPR
ncbi:MAG: hypothetical protein M3141_03565 [Actinomycetota bacterium]|nr:hypothetical protein [Actinomycetota bacterium]